MRSVLAAAAIASTLAVGGPAEAVKPCVSEDEFMTAPYAHKRHVEKFWAAEGRRTDVVDPGPKTWEAWEYRSCEHPKDGWVVVLYRSKTKQAQAFLMWTPDTRSKR